MTFLHPRSYPQTTSSKPPPSLIIHSHHRRFRHTLSPSISHYSSIFISVTITSCCPPLFVSLSTSTILLLHHRLYDLASSPQSTHLHHHHPYHRLPIPSSPPAPTSSPLLSPPFYLIQPFVENFKCIFLIVVYLFCHLSRMAGLQINIVYRISNQVWMVAKIIVHKV